MSACRECGLIHPPAPSGQCPVAKSRKLEGTEKGKKIIRLVSKLSTYLENSDDYETIINKIDNLLT